LAHGALSARVDLPEYRVRAAFLAADVAGQLVGRASVRFELNDFSSSEEGHRLQRDSGVSSQRYATAILRESIEIARSEVVGALLLTCDDDNLGSATVIERCGGVLEAIAIDDDGVAFRRY